MKRDFDRLGAEAFDVVVIGGGITGATIAWDAVLRGLSVALVERRDFGGATSSATGKLIHGGLRYLKNFELGVVRESLRERRIMETIAPHQVNPLPFVIPNYGLKDALLLKAGMIFYDMLGYDKGRLADPGKRLPAHRGLSKSEVLKLFPNIPKENLINGYQYYDCQMVSPEKLTFDFIQSAAEKGAAAVNWAEVVKFKMDKGRIAAATVRDSEGGGEVDVRGRVFINATGCWADRLLGLIEGGETKSRVARSKGIHIVIDSIHPTHALAMITKTERHVYMLPWRGRTLCGTTDTPFKADPDEFSVSKDEIKHFIGELNGCYPCLELKMDGVLASYGGLRPLADPDGAVEDSYDASRKHEVIDHAKEGLASNLLSALGGKYTTSRFLAQQVVDAAFGKIGKLPPACRTASTPLSAAPEGPIDRYRKHARANRPNLDAALVDHLVTEYGTNWEKVAEPAKIDPAMKAPLWDRAPEIAAQIKYAAENECAVHLDDAVCRRTDICALGRPDGAVLTKAARIMAAVLGWPEERIAVEVGRVEKRIDSMRAD
jgi:glycerol-3-phosphate dehydrogenase